MHAYLIESNFSSSIFRYSAMIWEDIDDLWRNLFVLKNIDLHIEIDKSFQVKFPYYFKPIIIMKTDLYSDTK